MCVSGASQGCGFVTYADGQPLAQSWRYKAQYEPSQSQAEPKACSDHATGKVGAVANPNHKGNDPTAQGDLCSDVAKKEKSSDPGDACGRLR